MKKLFRYYQKYRYDIFTVCGLFLIACAIYLYKVDVITPGVFSDEISVALSGEQLLRSGKFTPFISDNLGHATLVPYLVGASIKIFGRNVTAIRLPSILFGALDVVLFYLFLRLFLKRFISGTAALLLLFSYPLIVVSRLDYEITAALLFQILSIIFLTLAYKTKDKRYLIGFGLALGAGLYSYVGFRTFVIVTTMLSGFLVLRMQTSIKDKLLSLSLVILSIVVIAAPLLVYGLQHPSELTMRSNSLWLFGQGLPLSEAFKELQGATILLKNLFISYGDPNFRQNPTRSSVFDFGTSLLAISGVIYLWKKNKAVLVSTLFLSLSPIVNDIFSLERIPEFHYYGIGHPNTLRISGIIPIMYFLCAFGLKGLTALMRKTNKRILAAFLFIIVGIIITINWHKYYGQGFNRYIYEVNGVRMLKISQTINASKYKTVFMTPGFIQDSRVWYFTTTSILKPFTGKSKQSAIDVLSVDDALILDPRTDTDLIRSLIIDATSGTVILNIQLLRDPTGLSDSVIFTKPDKEPN